MSQTRLTTAWRKLKPVGHERSGVVVLQQLSEQVRECHQQADDAKARAEGISDPLLRKAYLDLEARWLFLARSQMFGERLEDFIDKRLRRDQHPPADVKLPVVGQLFDLLSIAIYLCDAIGQCLLWHSSDILIISGNFRFRGNSGHGFVDAKCLVLTPSGHSPVPTRHFALSQNGMFVLTVTSLKI